MKIAVLKEGKSESRVAISTEMVKRYVSLGFDVEIEANAGKNSHISDENYKEFGAKIGHSAEDVCKGAEIVLCIGKPESSLLSKLEKDTMVIGQFNPLMDKDAVEEFAEANLQAFSMDLMPRITRAQSMDVLSSQSNLAGYRAVMEAAVEMNKCTPMMMTAAGTVSPIKAMIIGAGVAGLQAIATARRLGGIVCATDVRPASKEQVESLGATFVMVESEETKDAETAGGYAKEMSADYKKKQAELVAETLKKQDMVICTALIPGRKAPTLITDEMLKSMKEGSVVVDLAASNGGNCEGMEADEIVVKHGVSIIGYTNMAGRVAVDASQLYARNLYNFIAPMVKDGKLEVNYEDELIVGTLLTRDGGIVNERIAPQPKAEEPKEEAGESCNDAECECNSENKDA